MKGGAGRRIRAAGERDLDRLAALLTLLFAHHAGAGPRFALRAEPEAALRDWLAARLAAPDGHVLLFEEAGSPAGLCVAALRRRPALFEETARGEIEQLFVREDARRRGVGRALVGAACAWLGEHGAPRVEIQVDRANSEGRAFWGALGFAPTMDVLDRPL